MPGRVVPWEISWRAVLGLSCSVWDFGSVSWDVIVVVFPFEVAIGVSVGVGSMIAEGAMIVAGFWSRGGMFWFLDVARLFFVFVGIGFFILK